MHPSTSASRSPWRPLVAALLLATSLVAITTIDPAPAAADPHAFADPIFSADARGDIATIGNVTTTCDPTYENDRWSAAESAAACAGAVNGGVGLTNHDGQPMPPINNRLSMRYVDVDDDGSTFSSSTAQLDIPTGATVLWAGLHWNGATDVPSADALYGSSDESPPPATRDRFRVKVEVPGRAGYTDLDASTPDGTAVDGWDDTNPGGTVSYGGFADVTDLVRAAGPGRYGVADVQSCTGFGGCFGSWSLTVAFADESLPPRNLNVWHGWQLTTPSEHGGAQEFAVNGIDPPPSGAVNARIGVVQADGDRGLGPDSLDIASPSSPDWRTFATADRPLAPGETDWFNSTVTTFGRRRPPGSADPNLLANLNQDIALVEDDEVIGNDDHSFRFRIQTASSESLYSQVVHSAVELYAPEIQIDKEVQPPGPVASGDAVTWTLRVRNIGIDPIREAMVTDPLPAGLELVDGSIHYQSGGPAALLGTKTATAGDDQASWDAATRTLSFAVGSGASASEGGTMGVAPAADGSHELVISYSTVVSGDPRSTVENVAAAHGLGRELDDPFGPLETRDDATASVSLLEWSDLGITKSDGEAVVRHVGDRFTYALEAHNGGPSPATGVVMTDELDPRLGFVESADGCTAAARSVTCPVGSLTVGQSSTRTFVVEVLELPGAGQVIPNLAIVDGDQPNPDCDAQTPDALCNEATEETPQPAIDLGITKTDRDASVRKVGDEYSYALEVTNAGPDDATEVRIDDELDAHLAFVSSEECTADGQAVTCDLGDLAADATATAELVVEVVELPDEGEEIPNLATVVAAEPDPDCEEPTPEALCNEDDELTPREVDEATTTVAPTTPPRRASSSGPSPRPGDLVRTGVGVVVLAVTGISAIALGAWALAVKRRRTDDPFW